MPLSFLPALLALAAELLDLTYAFDEQTIYWPTEKPFQLEVSHKGPTPGGYWYEANRIIAAEHGGTHLDAPVHFAKGKWSVEQIPASTLVGAAVVVDMSAQASRSADAELTPADLEAWEARHGRIPEGAIVLVRTGWGRYWPDKKQYLGTDKPRDVAGLHFPGIGAKAARWLATERKIKLVGIDTPSMDRGQSKDFGAHQVFGAANVPGLENIAQLDRLPPTGATIWALPMKIKGGSGAPCRIFAQLPAAPAGPSEAELTDGIRSTGPHRYTIRRALKDRLIAEPAAVSRSARLVPSVIDGRAAGFKLYAIRPGSVFNLLGLENGDTLSAVNGRSITSPEHALEAYAALRGARGLTLSVIRRGKPLTLEWLIVD
jgi:kynurenine formamidase